MRIARTRTTQFVRYLALLFAAPFLAAAQNGFTDAEADGIKAFLHDNFRQTNACMVIGLADQRGNRIFSAGKLDNGTDREVNGDTVFFIGSVSKTFTALLLQEAVKRGEMKLDDPVAKYLPASTKMPTHGGKEITLLDLATHAAGLPADPDNMTGATVKEQYETYTVEKIYAFLSGYTLSRDPGTEFEYSNVGMALLGHVIALKAGTNFESLVVNRICRPLHMDSTCIALTPELKARLAMGHDDSGKPSPPWKLQAYSPAGDVHSTANDLLKYKQTHTLRVTKVFPKSPASQAGLSAGMIIQKIENVPTAGKSVAECQRLLRASSSPKVRLELINPERKESNSVEVTRGKFLTSG